MAPYGVCIFLNEASDTFECRDKYSLQQNFRKNSPKNKIIALNARILLSNWYYCVIMHNYFIVLIYNLGVTLFLLPAQ